MLRPSFAIAAAGNVSRDLIQVLYLADNLVFMGAKVPQIVSNFRTRATGQLSLATNAINLLGCLVRIFTTIQEKAGLAMLCGFTIGAQRGRAAGQQGSVNAGGR